MYRNHLDRPNPSNLYINSTVKRLHLPNVDFFHVDRLKLVYHLSKVGTLPKTGVSSMWTDSNLYIICQKVAPCQRPGFLPCGPTQIYISSVKRWHPAKDRGFFHVDRLKFIYHLSKGGTLPKTGVSSMWTDSNLYINCQKVTSYPRRGFLPCRPTQTCILNVKRWQTTQNGGFFHVNRLKLVYQLSKGDILPKTWTSYMWTDLTHLSGNPCA